MQNTGIQRATIIFGIVMTTMMVLTAILPTFSNNTPTTTEPTAVPPTELPPAPTAPPAITDFSEITFDADYLHPSALYSVKLPTGWAAGQPTNTGVRVQTTLENADALARIEIYLEQPSEVLTDADALNTYFDSGTLRGSWSRYASNGYVERSRVVENDQLVIDFSMTDSQRVEYIARQTAWIQDGWIYVVRVSAPTNAQALLFFLMDAMPEQITLYPQFAETPVSWTAFFDETNLHIIRRPSTWSQTDGTSGQVVSIEGNEYGGVKLRVQAQDGLVEDEDAASAFAESLASNVEVFNVVPVTRDDVEGFSVTYGFDNADGDGMSGQVVLLNGADEKTHIANVQIPVRGLDLHSEEAQVEYPRIAQTMDTFSMLTTLNLPVEEEEVTSDES